MSTLDAATAAALIYRFVYQDTKSTEFAERKIAEIIVWIVREYGGIIYETEFNDAAFAWMAADPDAGP